MNILKKNQIKISVIVPVFNGEKYIERCINSVLHNCCEYVELIIVNDGSTDKTERICLKYKEIYSKYIIYFKQNNQGVVAARKKGISLSRGEWILFLDADDWLDYDNNIFMQFLSFDLPEVDIIAYKLVKEYGRSRQRSIRSIMPTIKVGEYSGKELAAMVIREDYFFKLELVNSLYAGLIRKSLILPILESEPDNIIWSEDGACMMLAYWDARKVIFLDEVIYHYRVNEGSVTRLHDKELYDSQLLFYTFLKSEFSKRNAWENMKKKIEWMMIRDFMIGNYEVLYKACPEYLYPFSDVKKGMRIALYGMGDMGQEYYRVLRFSSIYSLVFISDKKGKKEIKENSIQHLSPDELVKRQNEVDKVVITVTDICLSYVIRDELIALGMMRGKIALMNQNVLNYSIIDKIYKLDAKKTT